MSSPDQTARPVDASVSIVVPTRDRPASLRRCLLALRNQIGIEDPEIVVVDDRPAASSEDPAIARLIAETPGASRIAGGGRGPASARNVGAAQAGGAVVLFTDDDCEPEPEWAAALARAIIRGADAVGGRTVNPEPDDRLAEASQHIANYLGEHSRAVGTPFAASNNLGCRADAFAALPFDETYPLAAGEDRAWCERWAARGLGLEYEPDALVQHRQQLTPRSFWRQHVRYGRGAYRFGRERGGALPSPPSLYPRLLATAIRHGPGVGALVAAAQAATASGYAAEAIAARRA